MFRLSLLQIGFHSNKTAMMVLQSYIVSKQTNLHPCTYLTDLFFLQVSRRQSECGEICVMLLLLLIFSLSIALAQRGANVIHQSIMVLIRMSKLQQMVLARAFLESFEFKGIFMFTVEPKDTGTLTT